MSIVDPNGKDLRAAQQEVVTYKVGSVSLDTNAVPGDKLGEGLAGARQMATMQLMAAARQSAAQSGLHIPEASLQLQATAEASKIVDPFKMEPCAQAVFMMLAMEIEARNEEIRVLTDRLEKLEETCLSGQKSESSSADGDSAN